MHDRLKSRREIPAVGKLLEQVDRRGLPHALVVKTIRAQLAAERKSVGAGRNVRERIDDALEQLRRARLQSVINGTGVLIHTNLGRVPLADEALRAIDEAARNYSNLEIDLNSGTRGGRGVYLESALAELCGAESACVVNNCAAALVLMAHHFIKQKPEVIISRGELVQIGGGFRIGEILESTGAALREVGSTNKTTLSDYARAVSSKTAMILKVHRSNFFMGGFVASPASAEIAVLAHKKRIPFIEDLGSGAIPNMEKLADIEHEPTAAETLRAGADLVCFSGDKLFGGPQAGIIAGKARFVSALKREPLFRALRCGKLAFSALQATTELHLAKDFAAIPILNFLQTPTSDLQERAEKILAKLRGLPLEMRIEETFSQIGGGALPRSKIKSVALVFRSKRVSADEIATRLRYETPAVIGYIAKSSFVLDVRTVLPSQDQIFAQTLARALARP